MHIIDSYAYTNHLRRAAPAQKASLALLVVLLCLLLNRPLVGIGAALWMWCLTTLLAGIPARVAGRLLLAEATFFVLAVAGIAISIGTVPPPHALQSIAIGSLWLGVTPASLSMALLVLSRALGSAAAMNFLALTTPMVDLVELLRRMRVPPLLIDLLTLIYRFIFVLLESFQRITTAQESRLGYSTARRAFTSAGLLGSRLFLDAYQRSKRLHTALESRGYSGQLNVLPQHYQHDWRLWGVGVAMLLSLVLAGVAL
jgi:cobalt/nickel transport system permease protein